MNRFCCLLVALLSVLSVQGQDKAYRQYIEQYRDIAIEQMKKWHVPASITLAQGLLESGAGQSTLATKGNNHFGIKCHGWTGATIYRDDDRRNECFRAYKSAYDSYEDHSRFLATGQRYRSLFSLPVTDYEGWARGLKAAGYATSPTYSQALVDIIRRYQLDQYDRATTYDKFMVSRSRDVALQGQTLHPIYSFNKNYYLYARRGDTFRLLAEEVGISRRRLARYNELDKDAVLEEGAVVWLKKKRTKAPKDYRGRPHRVSAGESMYTIAQRYGIRLKSLYKMNHLSPEEYTISEGDLLRIR